MRIAMLSCNTGEGHNSTAKAICEVLENRGVECQIIDALSFLSPKFSQFVCNWHVRLYKYTPKLWDVGYRVCENINQRVDDRSMATLLSLGKEKLQVFLEEGQFDAIICPHVFSALMVTELRKSQRCNIPCYFVATDYSCCPYVDQCDMDGFFIPARELTEEFVQYGIPADKLIPSGIPVRQEFYHRGDREAARAALGLTEYDLVAILMCGSMGVGPIQKIAMELPDRLPDNSLLVVMCAKNEKLLAAMEKIQDPRLRVLGYCNQVPEYMDAADFLISKPGGLSSTEAANKRIPMVLHNSVGGVENPNFQFFLEHGYACGDEDADRVLDLAVELAYDADHRKKISEALEAGFRCNSAEEIADTVMAAVERSKGE